MRAIGVDEFELAKLGLKLDNPDNIQNQERT
jgi:hypothetical protein